MLRLVVNYILSLSFQPDVEIENSVSGYCTVDWKIRLIYSKH
jgi:hypothetical protein